jgi:hypothetical protein
MALRGIVYASEASVDFDGDALRELEREAAARNDETSVTGYLCFEDGHFVQYIEGERDAVTALMRRITADPRHRVLHTLHDDALDERRFPVWTMKGLYRRNFYGLEALLYDHLLFARQWGTGRDDESDVWRIVDRVCEMKTRLARESA